MASFGEISEPSSRATWEDWDDVAGEIQYPQLRWTVPLELPEKVDNFVLIENGDESILRGEKRKILEVNSIKLANLCLYKLQCAGPNNYLGIIKGCDMMLSTDVVKLLEDLIIKSKKIVTILVKSVSEFQTDQPDAAQTCLIRKVTTTNGFNLRKLDYPKLEQPNIVSGVSAGIFNRREHLGMSATALVFFMENAAESQVEDLQKLLEKVDIAQAGQILQSSITNSNLYM